MIGEDNCGNCKFMKKQLSDMSCHRNPPTGSPIMVMGPNGMPQMVGKLSIQPPVQAGGWCGEHRRKLAVAAEIVE